VAHKQSLCLFTKILDRLAKQIKSFHEVLLAHATEISLGTIMCMHVPQFPKIFLLPNKAADKVAGISILKSLLHFVIKLQQQNLNFWLFRCVLKPNNNFTKQALLCTTSIVS